MKRAAAVVTNSVVLLTGKVLTNLMAALAMMYVARALGNDAYGQLSVVFAYLFIFQTIAQFGIDTVFVREVSRAPDQLEAWFATALLVKVGLAVTAVLLSLAVLPFTGYPGQIRQLMALASISILFSFHTLIPGVFQVWLKTGYYVVADLAIQFLTSALLVVSAWNHAPLTVIVAILAFNALPLTIAYVAALLRVHGRPVRIAVHGGKIRHLLRTAFPLFLTGVCVSVCLRLDQLILYRTASSESLGLYAAAVRVAELPNFIPGQLLGVVFPLLNATCFTSREEFERMSWTTYRVMIHGIAPVVLLLAFYARELVVLFYGPQFEGAALPLAILAFGLICNFLGSAHSSIILAMGLETHLLLFTFIGGVASLACYLVLIPPFGITGAALASVFLYSSGGMLPQFLMPQTRHVTVLYYRAILENLPAAAAMAMVLFVGKGLPFFAGIPLSLGVYFLALFAAKGISAADLALLRQVARDVQSGWQRV